MGNMALRCVTSIHAHLFELIAISKGQLQREKDILITFLSRSSLKEMKICKLPSQNFPNDDYFLVLLRVRLLLPLVCNKQLINMR